MSVEHLMPSAPSNTAVSGALTPPHDLPERAPSASTRRSSTSLASDTSFSTARSTNSGMNSPEEIPTRPASPVGPLALGLPQNLRKSLSVDSFVRRDIPIIGTRTKRTNTNLDMRVPVLPPPGLHSRDYEHRAYELTRHRGVSLSTQGDYESSFFEDTDYDAWHSPSRRRSSLKGKDQQQPLIRPGELKLPPRTPARMPALSTTSSISSISTTPGTPMEETRRLHSTTSMQHIPTRLPHPIIAGGSGRTRSGSLGVKAATAKPTHINTSLKPKPLAETANPVTIAVVGSLSSGRSTLIRKGAKHYGLSDSSVLSAPPGMLGVSAPLRYHLDLDQPESLFQAGSSTGAQVDGALICYDSSSPSSFKHVEDLLSMLSLLGERLRILKTPVMVAACKIDLEKRVDSKAALDLFTKYDSGLVEVTAESQVGKDKMRRSFEWIIKAIIRERARDALEPDYINPASPQALAALAPWENPLKNPRSSSDSSVVATPTASSSNSIRTVAESHAQRVQPTATVPLISGPPSASRVPSVPTSPTRARSMSDLLSEHEKSRTQGRSEGSLSIMTLGVTGSVSSDQLQPMSAEEEPKAPNSRMLGLKPPRPTQWATLDELLHRLMFVGISGDDSTFVTNFFLTFRRFASPRSVLLAMQKRMRSLDSPNDDPMFVSYAQMRICHLLEVWIRDYPADFAVLGTAGALNALVRAIITKTYLLHYGCDFLPFTEQLPDFKDQDADWALPVENQAFEDDDGASDDDDSERFIESAMMSSSTDDSISVMKAPSIVVQRERKSSLPLTATLSTHAESVHSSSESVFSPDDPEFKKYLKELAKTAHIVNDYEPQLIANEITRIEAQYFQEIQKDSPSESITRFNAFSNNLGGWVVSLILCHDRPKHRAKQIEKFVEIAIKLRGLNNYSALRAFVAGINVSTYPTDPTMDIFKTRCPDLYKTFQSWDILFQVNRSHRAYRMALRSSKGACIPALEVHMSDLIKAHEGNQESNPEHPNKIHWGKFNMMGKFISSTTQCQTRCKTSTEYHSLGKNETILRLITNTKPMDIEMQRSRIAAPPEDTYDDMPRAHMPRTSTREPPASNLVRKLFSW
ncbi:hypothetical protein HWV62_27669 [Athelia sp. TMB]|nr:hypothetical protein HWV62_27669 [Athelia sp. TMB]